MRHREAPSDERTAISRERCVDRASSKLATFAQAINSTMPTAPIKVPEASLPTTEAFSLSHNHPFLDANRLSPDAAVEQEWTAFLAAWQWLRTDMSLNYRWNHEGAM